MAKIYHKKPDLELVQEPERELVRELYTLLENHDVDENIRRWVINIIEKWETEREPRLENNDEP